MSRLFVPALLLLAACPDADSGTPDTADPVDTGDTSDTSDTGDTTDTGDTSDTGDTAETGDTSDTSDTGDTADTADTGDSGTDACAEPADTTSTRVATPATFTDGDSTCDRVWSEEDFAGWPQGGACTWGYVWLRDSTRVVSLRLELPADDVLADQDWAYSFVPGHGATLEVVDTTVGREDLGYWTCSDYYETVEGTIWTAVAGRVEVESRWVCDTTDPSCGFAESEHHAEVRLVDIGLESSGGECAELPDTTLRVTLGISECGG